MTYDISGVDMEVQERASDLRKLIHGDTKLANKRLADLSLRVTQHKQASATAPHRPTERQSAARADRPVMHLLLDYKSMVLSTFLPK